MKPVKRHPTVHSAMAALNKPYDPIEIVINLLAHAVYDENRSDECADAVLEARAYLEQEGVE